MRRFAKPDATRERAAAYYARLLRWTEFGTPDPDHPIRRKLAAIEAGDEVSVTGWSIGREPPQDEFILHPAPRQKGK